MYFVHNMEDELYKEHILDNYRNPRNKYALADADISGKETNIVCGDEIVIYAQVDEQGVITAMSFTGDGCAISQAAASLLTDYAKGKHLDKMQEITQTEIEHLLGISLSMARARCALLPLQAFRKGLGS